MIAPRLHLGLRRRSFARCFLFALVGLLFVVFQVETMLIDVIDDLVGDIIAYALSALSEQANLRRRNIVLDQLRDNPNIVSPLLEANECII